LSINPEMFWEALQNEGLGLYFANNSLSPLVRFTQKMLELNLTHNLTRWTSDQDVLNYHLLDSAYCLPLLSKLTQLKEPQRQSWMDLGSGCGFPGAVVTTAFPLWDFTFMDSVGKKMRVLEECAQSAGWDKSFLVSRAEDLGKESQSRECWNGITARAVADFRVVLEYAMPLLTIGGHLVNWMTHEQLEILDASHKALSELRAKVVNKLSYQLPDTKNLRWIVLVEKVGITPTTYPRPVGKALKKPIQ